MKKLLIIDTFNFLHRAYHALPSTFRGPDGQPTNAVYGFTSMVLNVLEQIKPDYMVAALDGQEPTFRVGEFTAYKAQRKPMEDDLQVQIPKVFEILDAFEIKRIVVEGYEADDVIGTVAAKFKGKVDIVIVSNDKDLWQLAGNGNIIMVPGKKGEMECMGEKEVDARLGFEAEKVADYKGLRGDPSDNIPGVFGVGEVTATKLLQKYGHLEDIYKNIDSVEPESLRNKLLESYEQALMSKKLAQIILDVPFQLDLEECRYREINKIKVKEVLEKYHFKSLIKRMGFEVDGSSKGKGAEPPDNQLSLL
jgi:DNA polymerase-1